MQRVLSLVAAGRLAGGIGVSIVVLSLIPAGSWYRGLGVEGLDHFLAYAALAFALLLGCRGRLAWAASMGLAMALGVAIEIAQPHFHRGMEFRDIVANAAGIATGALAVLALRGIRSGLRRFCARCVPEAGMPDPLKAIRKSGAERKRKMVGLGRQIQNLCV